MPAKNHSFRKGLTLVELMITVLAVMILVVGVSGILAAGHRNYVTMYRRVNSEVVRNAYEAKSIFDRIVRKSTIRRYDLDAGGTQLYVYYYSDPTNLTMVHPDGYAAFYLDGTDLMMVQGIVRDGFFTTVPPPPVPTPPSSSVWMAPGTPTPIARNVDRAEALANGIFAAAGSSIRMVLTLDNENPPNNPDNTNKLKTLRMTVTSTAIRHNR